MFWDPHQGIEGKEKLELRGCGVREERNVFGESVWLEWQITPH